MEQIKEAELPVFNEDFSKGVEFLKSFDQSSGIDINNMLDIIEILTLNIVSNSSQNNEVMNQAWNIGTMVKVLKEKLPNELFLSIEDIVYSLETNNYLK